MKCPNCDFIEKDELFGEPPTCPKCGAIYEKALRVKMLKEKLEAQHGATPASLPSSGPLNPQRPPRAGPSAKGGVGGRRATRIPSNDHSEAVRVKVTDIDMPFWSMVQLLVKWALASIPAVFILILIFVGFTSLFGVLFG